MPEPTTRDEHVAEARRLARFVNSLYLDDSNHVGPREDYASDAEYDQALQFAVEMHRETTREMAVWADLAMVHIKIAEVLGQQPAEPAWTWKHNGMVHSSGKWEMEYIHSCETDEIRVRPGWYLYGDALPYRNPQLVGATVPEAIEFADRGIAHLATAQSGAPVWVASTRNLFVCGRWQLKLEHATWRLHGPACGRDGKAMHEVLGTAQDRANEEIARWHEHEAQS